MKLLLFLSFCPFIAFEIYAQKMDSVNLAYDIQIAKTDSLKNSLDSLFAIKKYKNIIDICKNTDDSNNQGIKEMNLIVAYFMLGDTLQSNQLIMKRISNYSDSTNACADAAYFYLQSDNLCWRYYQHIPSNKKHIDSILMSIYKMEKVSQPQYGMRVLNFFITDNFVREQLDYYHPLDRRRKIPKIFEPDTSFLKKEWQNNLDSVYMLYKNSGRIFSLQDIGSINFEQFLLFAHDKDVNHRKYYLKLIKEGVQRKACNPDRIISFILRSEYLKGASNKMFLQKIAPKMDSLKKKYNLPNYTFSFY